MSVKTRIAELNSRLADTLTEKGVEASANETTTSLIGKVAQIEQGSTVDGIVFPKEYFTKHPSMADFPYITITADMLEGMTVVCSNAFDGFKLEKLELPNSVQRLYIQSFVRATIKQPFIIPDSVSYAETQIFLNANIGHITTSKNMSDATNFFSGCTCHTVVWKGDIISSNQWWLTNANSLANLSIGGKIYCSIWVPISTLTPESIQNIIDALADLTGQGTQTLTLHASYVLTEEQKATITLKNWTLVQ